MNAPKEAVIKMYAPREEIYPREVKGRYATLRWACVWLTQLLFYGLPWIQYNGRQAVLFDLGARKFHLFGLVLWPQDFIYLAGLLIVCAYGLFLVTTVAGRIWCGYACPQTVYTELFLWIERRIEGARSARIRLDRQPWNGEKIGKKTAKHAAWMALALWTGFSFVGYFTPIESLLAGVRHLDLGPWEAFWVLFYGLATYGNAGWLREQVCKYMCPYARFQSAMFDKDTLVVTYDRARGEPRRPGARQAGDKLGDCIDCTLCVQVCPTGIDIRRGLQYECIGCAACIDACDTVMDKVDKPKGLIRYATENALARGWDAAQVKRRLLRPRVLGYAAVLALMVAGMSTSLALRVPLKVDVIRDRGSMGREVEDGRIENVYRLQLMNTSEEPRLLRIAVAGLPGAAIVDEEVVEIGGVATRALPVRVRAEGPGKGGSHRIEFTVTALDDASVAVREEAAFIVPH
ncbi:cytochrome c oxidase accessory protein CcoG [Massilia sp. Mn16-1_5]|uniref:cytochrome c oxidase accessory protein CcoG n=1 Tax=Massilia sp. Mn16-1_5 TaxID=2079199 RepID=UPI00109EBD3D|nr:cytochrome c oxidase accessory protein CcoG [Massilia sp. Mn16-1_5]THC39357.1 cytochrome c oxidase accessory protein CcoG [Massilia sp. Mn16-1_5]